MSPWGLSGGAVLRGACLDASELHADIAQLGIELQRMHAALAADARLLGAAERRAQVAQEPRIDPADAHVQRRAQAMGRADVAGPYGRGQAVRRSVGQGNGFLFRIERRDVAARPENFLLDDGGRFRQACPHGGLDPGARGQPVRHVRHAAARHHRGPGSRRGPWAVPA
ncbi:hypothetical protein G6F68_013234 [Rhizopus microsporus]|nr:hypothetical protein G6F68_013234 [Rhizopus microsporus]